MEVFQQEYSTFAAKRGSKFVRKASNSTAPTVAPTSTPGQASSFATAISTTAMDDLHTLKTRLCIIGSGPAAHTAAIYASRAKLKPILFEGDRNFIR
ncbi:thioredoxin reductase 2 [Quercus suber]|uniref:Thioredoxin reductase 2 n=1 Tax=Quercus suber TaxID=58331 RepID=A0AAW0IMS2_QUESU